MAILKGRVDDYGRALVPIAIRSPVTNASLTLEAWIDTGFTGTLFLTPNQVGAINLPAFGESITVLADGSRSALASHLCEFDWFDRKRTVQALSAPNRFALIGVHLLENLILKINFDTCEVELSPTENYGKDN